VIYLAIKYYPDHKNRPLIEKINLACEKAGEVCLCVTKDIEFWGKKNYSSQELMQISFEKIRQSDFVLIEFTEKGVGIGIEAGYAYALNIPIIVIHPATVEVSETLRGIAAKIISYQDSNQIPQIIFEMISEFRTL